ncbi:hypothetical protein N0V88_006348 [Collariella sp. IMI 366227]|nr:hypothetical protein N0V88_006348 [Collariella sp. IMI 366227]
MAATPLSTPKRKHSQMLSDVSLRLNTTKFTFDIDASLDDGSLPDLIMHDADNIALFANTMAATKSASQSRTELTAKKQANSPKTIHFALDDAVVDQSETNFIGDGQNDDDTTAPSITIYDPDDSDDDGTGINGIGFKPTPAIAYSRALRRRQQLAEYKKREEREARARRSLRRGG